MHTAPIISRGGIPVIISALIKDFMSLTIANLPITVTASFWSLSSDWSNGDDAGQCWSTWKFKVRTMPLTTTGGGTTYFMSGFSAVSRIASGVRVDADAGAATELTGTVLEQSKGLVSIGTGVYYLDSVGSNDLFAYSTKSVDDGCHKDKNGVVRIDVLSYSRNQPSKP